MPDYSKMYQRLFRAQTQAIDLLQKAQQDTEEMYISAPEDNMTILQPKKPEDGKLEQEE